MAPTNGKTVRLSSQILNYGPNFSYKEVGGPMRFFPAIFTTLGLILIGIVLALPFSSIRKFIRKFLPAPGTGPSREVRENSAFRTIAVGHSSDPKKIVKVQLDMKGDCGYLATSVMISEAALCLTLDREKLPERPGGVYTPIVAMGDALVQRFKDAGVKISVEVVDKF
jgi:short subunit dehydrogenase-like uncharacterized protein